MYEKILEVYRAVLFEYHQVVVPFIEHLDQLEVCLTYSRLLTGIPIFAVFQNLMWYSNKTSLFYQTALLISKQYQPFTNPWFLMVRSFLLPNCCI